MVGPTLPFSDISINNDRLFLRKTSCSKKYRKKRQRDWSCLPQYFLHRLFIPIFSAKPRKCTFSYRPRPITHGLNCNCDKLFPRLAFENNAKRRKLVLIVSICSNLGLLGFSKYFNFFVDSAESVLLQLGVPEATLIHLDIILPVGISFYTFQTMSYTIDIYRGNLKPCKGFLDFALFVSFFPTTRCWSHRKSI